VKEIKTISHMNAKLIIPGSKSISHRAVIAAALADGASSIKNFLMCEDTFFTIGFLRQFGVQISVEKDSLTVNGLGGKLIAESNRREFFLGNSGTSLRFLLSMVCLAQGEFILKGNSRMSKRPIGDLVSGLNQLGVQASCIKKDGFPPVLVKANGISGGKAKIKGEKSSQFVSSLLLSAPYAKSDVEIEVLGKLVSRPYVDITLDVMKRFGIVIFHKQYRYFEVSVSKRYLPCQFKVEGDVSSASYFWAAAALTGGKVLTSNIYPDKTLQGDIVFLDILEEMGCRVERKRDQVEVHGDQLSGIEIDMGRNPDLVPTLSILALFSRGKTAIRNVAHLRHKESDRLHSIAFELQKLGADVEELVDGLVIQGGKKLSGTVLDAHGDHRMAMSLALVGLKIPGVKIKGEGAVNKSLPSFWVLWNELYGG
jgi:3-phosphoshikimate 1-carboxyvinyltransferase